MATLKENFGYALTSAKTGKVVRIINVPEIITEMRKELKNNSNFKGSYSDNVVTILFNSMFEDNFDLAIWLVNTIEAKGIEDNMLNEVVGVKFYFASDKALDGYQTLNNRFLQHIQTKRVYSELPLIYSFDFKMDNDDQSHAIMQKDLLNPFIGILKLGEQTKCTSEKKKIPLDRLKTDKDLYSLYLLLSSGKKVSSKSLDDVKNALSVINTYICNNYQDIKGLNYSEFEEKLLKYNEVLLNIEKPASKEHMEIIKDYRNYVISVVKNISFEKLYEVITSEYYPLFQKVLSYVSSLYINNTRYEDDNDHISFK